MGTRNVLRLQKTFRILPTFCELPGRIIQKKFKSGVLQLRAAFEPLGGHDGEIPGIHLAVLINVASPAPFSEAAALQPVSDQSFKIIPVNDTVAVYIAGRRSKSR